MNRDNALKAIRGATAPVDFCIIGGGATGLGTAVDAAARGYSVVLIEQSDFAKGTSSRSTKLVHGGVRYLQQGNVALVLEALKERGRLAKNAPHLVSDQAFVIPNYKWWEGPFYGVGMKVYDGMAGKLGLGPSKWLSKEETVAKIPTIETDGLDGGVVYHDGQFDDARLAVNLAQTATQLGAKVVNYVRCDGLTQDGKGLVTGALATDLETGEEFEIAARCVINATGVFTDEVRKMEKPEVQPMVTASQGIHIVLPREFLPGDSAIMIPKTDDGRVLFAVPWHDCVVVGTTDTPVDEVSLEPRAFPDELEFIMTHAAKYLTKNPQPSDVLSVFAGLRPLVRPSGDSSNTAEISRDHTIVVSEGGLVTVCGGKWTTYRKMAEDVIDQAMLVAGVEERPCETVHLQIHGWTHQDIDDEHLAVYGADAESIKSLRAGGRVHPKLNLTLGEVRWHARHEMARTVDDVLSRRHRALLLDAKSARESAVVVARVLAHELEKDQEWQDAQVEAFRELALGYLL